MTTFYNIKINRFVSYNTIGKVMCDEKERLLKRKKVMKGEDRNIYFVRTTFEVENLPRRKGKNRASDVRGRILYIIVKASFL